MPILRLALLLAAAPAASAPPPGSAAEAAARSPEATAEAAEATARLGRTRAEAEVLAADARQRDAVANADLAAIAAGAHPNLRVNAPSNHILTRDDLVRMVGSGEIRNEVFVRIPEAVVVTGDVAVVMGRERVFPGAASEQARMYGRRPLERRYTNVYRRQGGKWLHLARHANVVPPRAGE